MIVIITSEEYKELLEIKSKYEQEQEVCESAKKEMENVKR